MGPSREWSRDRIAEAHKAPVPMNATALVVGGALALYCLAWVLDFRGWATRLLGGFYRLCPWVWPGEERSYVSVNRYGGWFGVVVGLAMVVAGLRQ